jgi:hypothetical protein
LWYEKKGLSPPQNVKKFSGAHLIPIQYVSEVSCKEVKRAKLEAGLIHSLVKRLKTSGAIPILFYVSFYGVHWNNFALSS